MKVICVDNYDRPGYIPVVIAENLSERSANSLADQMNEVEDELSANYYMVVKDNWQYDF